MKEKTAKKILQKVKKDYSEIAEEFSQTRQTDWPDFKLFLKYIKTSGKLADMGCGNGRFYEFLKKNGVETNYTGIDNNEKLLKKAKEKFPEANLILGDMLSPPLQEESQDMVVNIAALHHIPSKKLRGKAVEQMHGILKKNGILILTVWNLFQPKYKKYLIKSYLRSFLTFGYYDSRDTFIPWGKTGVNRYYYAFKVDELENLLKKIGFKILEKNLSNNTTLICQKS